MKRERERERDMESFILFKFQEYLSNFSFTDLLIRWSEILTV